MNWKELQQAYVGKRFRRRVKGEPQQTARVLDVNLGGAVIVRFGRARWNKTIEQAEWLSWVSSAKQL